MSNLYASWISATSAWPDVWNVAAATIRMAALMTRAKVSAIVESRKA